MRMILAVLLISSVARADFFVSVSIMKAGEEPKGGVVELSKGKCTTKNGPNTRVRDLKVCKEIGDQIERDESTYSVLPWINNPDVPSFVVKYKGPKSSWTRETGVATDAQSKAREALRKLAVHVLETAQ